MAYWERKKENEFVNQKVEMKQGLDSFFSDIIEDLGSTDDFIKKYIPTFSSIQMAIKDLETNNQSFESKLEKSTDGRKSLMTFLMQKKSLTRKLNN